MHAAMPDILGWTHRRWSKQVCSNTASVSLTLAEAIRPQVLSGGIGVLP